MNSKLSYIPQLDALRAIAVILVVNFHWLGGFWTFGGGSGVTLFFVLSGFLITRILLYEKYQHPDHKLKVIGNFIARRTLRIFPIYYLFIFFFFLIGDPYMRQHIAWYISYCSNIHFFNVGMLDTTMYAHTWSLATEEQFYLIWPWLLLFINRKHELKLIGAYILTGIVFRIILEVVLHKYSITLLPSSFDAFGIGALLAYITLNTENSSTAEKLLGFLKKHLSALTIFPFILSMVLFHLRLPYPYAGLANIFFQTFFSIFSMAFIYHAVIGFKGSSSLFFNNKAVLYVGKISYGIYLYHKVIPWAYSYAAKKLHYSFEETGTWQYFLYLATVILVAHLSWKLVETPVIRLKKRFVY